MNANESNQVAKTEKEVLLEKLAKATKKLHKHKMRLIEYYKFSIFACKKCKSSVPLGKVVYVTTHWYERPYGCTGGDNWYTGEKALLCPECGYLVILNSQALKDKYSSFEYGITPSSVYAELLDEAGGTYYKNFGSLKSKQINFYGSLKLGK